MTISLIFDIAIAAILLLCPFTDLILYTTRSQNTVDSVLYDALTFVLRRYR